MTVFVSARLQAARPFRTGLAAVAPLALAAAAHRFRAWLMAEPPARPGEREHRSVYGFWCGR